MHTNLSRFLSAHTAKLVGFAAACIMGSFLVGIRSAGEVQPFDALRASTFEQANQAPAETPRGDIDGDGLVSVEDAILLLEMIQEERPLSEQALLADPDGDGRLTVGDALDILRSVQAL